MRRKGIFIVCLLLLVVAIGTILFLKWDRGHKMSENATVRVVESDGSYTLLKNGKPFYIKGASGDGYIKELAQAGGNTIRLYDTINTGYQLDEAYQNGIAVILDIPLPDYRRGNWVYSSDEGVTDLKSYVSKYIEQHKNHPALLYWNLGNELIYPLTIFPNRFTKTVNDLIDLVHQEDPNHPVGTTVAGTSRAQTLGIHLHSPKFDLIGYNVFGSVKILEKTQKQLSYFMKLKPYYISECGDQGPWEAINEYWYSIQEKKGSEKAKGYYNTYKNHILNKRSMLGSTAFYWGQKFEGTPDWFNVFDEAGRKSPIYHALKSSWEETDLFYPLEISTFKFKDLDPKDNRIFRPDEKLQIEAKANSFHFESLNYDWNLYKESSSINDGWVLLDVEFNLSNNGEEVILYTPKNEGAYRLVLRVYDSQQNYSTANIPFYVLDPNDKKE